jgi:hypothetical protein
MTGAIPLGSQISMNELLSNAIAKFGVARIFRYSAMTTNCQRFIADVLEASGLITNELREYILQNVDRLIPKWAERFAQFTTDLSARAKIAIEGEGRMIVTERDLVRRRRLTALRARR